MLGMRNYYIFLPLLQKYNSFSFFGVRANVGKKLQNGNGIIVTF